MTAVYSVIITLALCVFPWGHAQGQEAVTGLGPEPNCALVYPGTTSALMIDKKGGDAGEADRESPYKYHTMDALFTLYQPYLVNIEAYEPIYFLVGADPSKSKF